MSLTHEYAFESINILGILSFISVVLSAQIISVSQ